MIPTSEPRADHDPDRDITSDAQQDCRPGPVRVAISPPVRYARAGAYVDASPPAVPTRVQFLTGDGRDPVGASPTGPENPPPAATDEQAETAARPPRRRYPLRRRGRNLRAVGHAAYAATDSTVGELAAAAAYARSVLSRADEAGMHSPELAAAAQAAVRAVMAVGDIGTAAMHTWDPAASHQAHTITTPASAPHQRTPARTAAAATGHTTARATVHPAPHQSAPHPAADWSHQGNPTDPGEHHHTTRHTGVAPHHPGPGEHTSRGGVR